MKMLLVWHLTRYGILYYFLIFCTCTFSLILYLLDRLPRLHRLKLNSQPGLEAARLVSQTWRLLMHEYDFAFYLRERVIQKHSPGAFLATPAFPSVTMHHLDDTLMDDSQSLTWGLHYRSFLLDMPYIEFSGLFLLREEIWSTPQVIYDWYTALRGGRGMWTASRGNSG